jgi:nitrous oxide reductase accessory protein NosL
MLRAVALTTLALIFLAACTATEPKAPPTPFVVGEKKVVVVGCEKLREEVKQWNEEHPNKPKKVADC